MSIWRVGRKLGRTLYRDDELIGMMDRAADADLIVRLVNAEPEIVAALVQAEHALDVFVGRGEDCTYSLALVRAALSKVRP